MPSSIQARLGRVRATYQFIKSQRQHYNAETLCGALSVAPSGNYAWLERPVSLHNERSALRSREHKTSIRLSSRKRPFLDFHYRPSPTRNKA